MKIEGIKQEVKATFEDSANVQRCNVHGEQNEQAARTAVLQGDGVKVSLSKSEKTMAEVANTAGVRLAANLFSENFAKTAKRCKKALILTFFAEYRALKNLGGKNAEIFKETCKDAFSGLYEKVDVETLKACRADAVDAYKERLNAEKMAKQAAKVEGAISAAVAAAGLSEEQAAALMAAGLLKY